MSDAGQGEPSRVSGFWARVSELLLKYRFVVLVGALMAWMAAGWLATQLEFNYSFWTLFVSDHPEVVKLERYHDQWGEDTSVVFIGLRARDGQALTPDGLAVVDALEREVEKLDGIESVTSVLSASTIRGEDDTLIVGPLTQTVPRTAEAAAGLRAELQDSRLLRGNLISENGRTTAIAARIRSELRDASQRNPVLRNIERLAAEATTGTELQPLMVGIPVAQWVYSQKLSQDLSVFLSLSGMFLALILAVMFRSLIGVLLPLGVVGAATTFTLATMHLTDGQFNMINTAIPTLMLVIGIADAIHMMAHFRQRVANGMSRDHAIADMLSHLGPACFLTSMTTAVGFASLLSARIATVKDFGLYASIGIGYAFIFNLVLIPVGLSLVRRQQPLGGNKVDYGRGILTRALDKLAIGSLHHPGAVLLLGVALVAVAVFGTSQVRIESRMFEEVPDDDPVVQAHRTMEEDLPGVTSFALDVTTEAGAVIDPEVLQALDAMAATAERHAAVDRATGLADIIKEMHRANHNGDSDYYAIPDSRALIAQYLLVAEGDLTERVVNAERSRTQVWMRGPEVLSSTWEDLRAKLERQAAELPPGVEVVVTGGSSMAMRALRTIVRDILSSLVGAAVVIFLLMSLLFRSLRVGLISMVPNLLPLLFTVAVMGFGGIWLRTSTVVIFSISLGLAVDDTIHFLVRFRRELARTGGTVEGAIHAAMRWSGRAIVYTSLLLIGGFWILLLSNFKATQDIGGLGGVTLISALFADLLLLPALLQWLPARFSRHSVAVADAVTSER